MQMVMSYVNLRQNSVKYVRPMMFEYAANGNELRARTNSKKTNNTQNPMRTPHHHC